MASVVTTQTDYTAGGLAQTWTLYSDGSVTITNAQGGTVNVAATPATIAQAQALQTANTTATNQAALKDYLASALPTLRTLDTQAKTLSTITLSGTTTQQLAQVQAALRQIGAGLDTVLVGLVKVARLLSDQLDGTT